MTQNSDTNGVIKTPDCSFEQFQPTNMNQSNFYKLVLQCCEQIAKYYKEGGEKLTEYYKSVIPDLNSQNPQLSSQVHLQKQKEQIEMEQWIKKYSQI